ncbi:nuclear transport factor 2 family protein [Streptomyces chartreusis]|uniref:nuclear transport factor 2 family protein n=1 Tax=Streptomyces chartreusis TaxID=1969 RepID=UPI0036C5230E
MHARLSTPIRAHIEEAIVEGEWATVRFRSHDVLGGNGNDFSMQYCWGVRVVAGRIVEITGFYDTKKMNDLFTDRCLGEYEGSNGGIPAGSRGALSTPLSPYGTYVRRR